MKYKKRTVLLSLFTCAAMLASCAAQGAGDTASGTGGNKNTGVASISNTISFDSEDHYFDWKNRDYTAIDLAEGEQTITKSGIYEITGTLADGSLVVDIDKDADAGILYLVLNNASISSADSAPIYIKDAEKVVLILENGSENSVYQGSGCVADENGEPSAAVFSKTDLTITGGGVLNVTSDYNDGITSKDTLKITDGTLAIKATADGIVGKDVLAVEKGGITITAGKDGMRSTNDTDDGMGNIFIADGSFAVASGNDAIQAYGVLQIEGGSFDLVSGGGYSENTARSETREDFGGMGGGRFGEPAAENTDTDTGTDTESRKGLKATGSILINNGAFTISSYDDSVHSNGAVAIGGGTFTLMSGDDAVHADTDVTVGGGTITVTNSYEGIEGASITVGNGKINVVSSDDGFNVNDASGLLTVNGGEISINAGGDGIDSNGSVKMTGGTAKVDGPTSNNNGAIDYVGGFEISGGTLLAAGSSGMAQCPDSNSTQLSILMYFSASQAAGTEIALKDAGGNVIAAFTPAKQFASVAISSPDMEKGQSYTLYSGGVEVVTFTASDTVTYLNESGVTENRSGGPGGGMPGGGMQGGDRQGGNMPDGFGPGGPKS